MKGTILHIEEETTEAEEQLRPVVYVWLVH